MAALTETFNDSLIGLVTEEAVFEMLKDVMPWTGSSAEYQGVAFGWYNGEPIQQWHRRTSTQIYVEVGESGAYTRNFYDNNTGGHTVKIFTLAT